MIAAPLTRVYRLLGAAALLAAPSLAPAQSSDRPVSFGVSGGLSLPMGDLGDAANSGFVVAGHVYFKPASINTLRFRGDVSYDRWGAKGSGGDVNLRSLGFVANAIYDLPGESNATIRPYLLGGVGLYNSKATIDLGTTTGSTPSSTDAGIQVGGGLTFQLAGFSTFAEAKFVNVFGDGSTRWIPISFGIHF